MLRSLRLTISLLALGSVAIPWLQATTPSGAAPARTASHAPMAEKSTVKDEHTDADLTRRFNQIVRPFIASFCTDCHGGATPTAGFDLQPYSTIESVVDDFGHWALVLRRL